MKINEEHYPTLQHNLKLSDHLFKNAIKLLNSGKIQQSKITIQLTINALEELQKTLDIAIKEHFEKSEENERVIKDEKKEIEKVKEKNNE